jgi:hypothetical protein
VAPGPFLDAVEPSHPTVLGNSTPGPSECQSAHESSSTVIRNVLTFFFARSFSVALAGAELCEALAEHSGRSGGRGHGKSLVSGTTLRRMGEQETIRAAVGVLTAWMEKYGVPRSRQDYCSALARDMGHTEWLDLTEG